MSTEQKKLISTKPLSLLITIVHKAKADFYVDLIEQYSVNMQMVLSGNGTTKTTIYVDETGTKAVIMSIISDDNIKKAVEALKEKFESVRDGKGVAYIVPLTKVMGAQFYNFLSNNKTTLI